MVCCHPEVEEIGYATQHFHGRQRGFPAIRARHPRCAFRGKFMVTLSQGAGGGPFRQPDELPRRPLSETPYPKLAQAILTISHLTVGNSLPVESEVVQLEHLTGAYLSVPAGTPLPGPEGHVLAETTSTGILSPGKGEARHLYPFHGLRLAHDTVALQCRLSDTGMWLVLSENTPQARLLTPDQFAFVRAFAESTRAPYRIEEYLYGIPCPGTLRSTGTTLTEVGTPLPNGGRVGASVGIGLGRESTDQAVRGWCYVPEEGIWLRLSALSLGIPVERYVVFHPEKSGKEAVGKNYSLSHWNIARAFREARAQPNTWVLYQGGLTCGEAINSTSGATQSTTPTPSGRPIGKGVALGFGQGTSDELILGSMFIPSEGYWLNLRATVRNVAVEKYLLFHENSTGRNAIVSRYSQSQWNFVRAYREARAKPGIWVEFEGGLPCEESIDRGSGSLHDTTPTPSGRPIGSSTTIGIRGGTQHERIVASRYEPGRGFRLRLRANHDGNSVERYILLDEHKTGSDAIRQTHNSEQFRMVELYDALKVDAEANAAAKDRSFPFVLKNGLLSKKTPLLSGDTIEKYIHLGWSSGPAPESSVIEQATYFPKRSDATERIVLTVRCRFDSGEFRSFRLIVTDTEFTVIPERASEDLRPLKGIALDHLLAYLAPQDTELGWVRGRGFRPFSDSHGIVAPNLSRPGRELVHAKWGNFGADLLDYLLKNTRLAVMWSRRSSACVPCTFVVAEERAVEPLRRITSTINETFPDQVKWTVQSIEQYGRDRLAPKRTRSFLAQIKDAALSNDRGWFIDFCSKQFQDTTVQPPGPPDGAARRPAPDRESIVATLKAHRWLCGQAPEFFLNFDAGYHIESAIFCSSALDRFAGDDEVAQLVSGLYPQLRGGEAERSRLREALDEVTRWSGGDTGPTEPAGEQVENEDEPPLELCLEAFDLDRILNGDGHDGLLRSETTPTTNTNVVAPVVRSVAFFEARRWVADLAIRSPWQIVGSPPSVAECSLDERSLLQRGIVEELLPVVRGDTKGAAAFSEWLDTGRVGEQPSIDTIITCLENSGRFDKSAIVQFASTLRDWLRK